MDQKWLMLVVDGSKSLKPHWPYIFSNYVQKIIRNCYHKWKEEPNKKHTKVEFGLVMYNVQHGNTEWAVEGSYWTRNKDEFLKKLSSLTFHATESISNPFTVHGLAEALVMFPKPPIGNGSEEFYEGERHCIVVPATEPSATAMAVHLPKMQNRQFFGSHTESSLADSSYVARFYVKLGVSLSVVSPKQFSGWRTIFRQADKTSSSSSPEDEANNAGGSTSGTGPISVLIAPNFKEAIQALTYNNLALLSPFFSDEGTNFVISSLMDDDDEPPNNSHQNTTLGFTPQTLLTPDLSLPPLNSRAYNDIAASPKDLPATSMSTEQDILNTSHNNNIINSTNHIMMSINSTDLSHNFSIQPSMFQQYTIPPNNETLAAEPNTNDDNGVAVPPSSSSRRRKRGEPEAGRERRQRMTTTTTTTTDLDGLQRNEPLLRLQLCSFPLQHNPFHVTCWEGAICIGDGGNFKVIASAKAYRRTTGSRTIAKEWPLWLHISDFIALSAARAISSSQNRIGDLELKMLKTNKDRLFKFLTTRHLCATFNLPSQTLILTPTSEPSRFVGAVFQSGTRR